MDVEKVLTALREGNIKVHYQPIMKISNDLISDLEDPEKSLKIIESNDLAGLEALVRWEPYSPDEFLPKLIKHNLLGCITHLVAKESSQAIANTPSIQNKWISINIGDDDFLPYVLIACMETRIEHERIRLEISEEIKTNKRLCRRLKYAAKLKFHLKIDDFGKDKANFDALISGLFKSIKIDIQFIKELSTNANNRLIVQNIVAICHGYDPKIEVIAEGCEDLETLKILKSLNVDLVQGFVISPAVPLYQLLD